MIPPIGFEELDRQNQSVGCCEDASANRPFLLIVFNNPFCPYIETSMV